MLDTLEKCPFCGSEAIIEQIHPSEEDPYPFWVSCSNENCPLSVSNLFCGETIQEIITLWNNRYEEDDSGEVPRAKRIISV